jgi:hypothetical protein
MKHSWFLSRASTLVLTLLLLASCAAPQRSFTSIPSSPTVISTQSIPTPTFLPTPATHGPGEPALTQPVTVASEVSAWLRENAIPFDTTDPNSDFEDLMPLKELIGDARIVALGEATHGTHEFFQLKHRMLRFLVE